VAGSGRIAFSGDGGPATSASLSNPLGLAVDAFGNFYIADLGNNRVRKVNAAGTISTYAGNGQPGVGGDGGPALNAQLYSRNSVSADLQSMAMDAAGNLYITDSFNHSVRKVDPSGVITLFAGSGLLPGDGGPATKARVAAPAGVAVDGAGNVYIADSLGSRIRKVDTTGIISTVAGVGMAGYSGDGGLAAAASIGVPLGIAIDTAGNLYFNDYTNGRIRKVDTAGIITTVAGNGMTGVPARGDGGPATSATLSAPGGVAVDRSGNLYFSDGPSIRKVNAAGIITTIVDRSAFLAMGGGDVAVDAAGNLYFTDSSRIRKFGNAPLLPAPPPPPAAGTITKTVSAAGQQGAPFAAESIVIATGTHLATDSAAGDLDRPPMTLAGTMVSVTDSAGVTRPAVLFSLSPTQVTYQIPPGTAPGTATVTITAGDGVSATSTLQIAAVAPGIYTLNSGNLAKAYLWRVSGGGEYIEDVYEIDATGAFIARPITVSNGDQVTLIVYGTGFRAAGGDVSATVGGVSAPVLYAGPQGVQPGLDQFNVLIPPQAASGGLQSVAIVLTAAGQTANTVSITVQ
jgi:uncharacterized protein (TIGR03437 family)